MRETVKSVPHLDSLLKFKEKSKIVVIVTNKEIYVNGINQFPRIHLCTFNMYRMFRKLQFYSRKYKKSLTQLAHSCVCRLMLHQPPSPPSLENLMLMAVL